MSEPLPRQESEALDVRARALLDFEREWPLRDDGSKEAAIRAALGISKQRYHELLQRIADLPEAYAYDPLTVLRLRRRRQRMEQRRNAEALGERRQ